jgi:DNA-binding Lrp family transcriptional regulator
LRRPRVGPVTFRRYLVLIDYTHVVQLEGFTVVQAYILVQTEVGRSAAVAGQITELPGVVSAEDVTGPYDVIVRTEAETMDDLGKLIVARIQVIEGITRTLTCPVVNLG